MGKDIVFMTLEYEMNNQHELYRMKKNSHLRFRIGYSLQGKNLRIFTNYPVKSDIFIRDKYFELEIINPSSSNNKYDSFDNYTEFKVIISGAYQFFITENGTDNMSDRVGEGYFIVDPRFSFTADAGKSSGFELDGLVLQTYLAKNLGPFSEWKSRLDIASNCKYNMIHFTPLQELGYSQSAYSLKDQLKVNPAFSTPTKAVTWKDVEKLVNQLHNDHKILSMTDLVYNHSSNDTPWIHEHPECAYNVVNSPHLRPAYLIDRAVWNLTVDVAKNKYSKSHGLENHIHMGSQIETLRNILWEKVNEIKIHEFYVAHVDNQLKKFKKFLTSLKNITEFKSGELKLIHGKFKRLESTIDFEIAANKFFKEHRDIQSACNQLKPLLTKLNYEKCLEIDSHLVKAVDNVMANISYRFIDDHGLRLGKVSVDSPLMWNYFYHPSKVSIMSECEALMDSGEQRIMAFNGWVMNDDPLRSFAEETSNVYLRRELIVWGDSVKLRYGKGPEDCPYLWNKMFAYTELTANTFHAVRLDNCHSTPIHVAQAMLDRARAIRPNLYVAAELFTGSEGVDNFFVNKLGINSLIREAQAANSCRAQGGLIYSYGAGFPTGSFTQPSTGRKLLPTKAHALLYDMTHDNQSAVATRSPFDLLPTAAMTLAACCAIGSTRGYDEVVPHYIDVVNEKRLYATYGKKDQCGLLKCRSIINSLHQRLAVEHYTHAYVDQLDDDVIAITRHCPEKLKSVIVVSHSAFRYPGHTPCHRHLDPLNVSGQVTQIIAELSTYRDVNQVDDYKLSTTCINGLPGIWVNFRENTISDSTMVKINRDTVTGQDYVNFINFPPGSVLILEIDMVPEQYDYVQDVHSIIAKEFNTRLRAGSSGHCLRVNELMLEQQISKTNKGKKLKQKANTDEVSLQELVSDLSLSDLSRLLYRSNEEEMAETKGKFGAYEVPGFGKFVFCGLQGMISELEVIRERNDLGHPICDNLRAGNWMIEYMWNRLIHRGGHLAAIGTWMRSGLLGAICKLPRFLIPSNFEMALSAIYFIVQQELYYRLGDSVVFGSSFYRALAANSVMLCSNLENMILPPLAKELDYKKDRVSLSAGLPHFAEGIWRNWGRDTFIALPGLLLRTERFDDSMQIILTYAATLRHGLIPNLLGDGLISRYNARDATWFWLQAIKEYELAIATNSNKNFESILNKPVARLYPSDSCDGRQNEPENQPLHVVMQECLQRHADGIKFHERNAGPQIDEHMKPEGFHVEAGIRNSTKFPFGGNSYNCGTWMDKMGSSSESGNKGTPATPRDGSAVEIVGLCASVLEWLIEANNKGLYPNNGVTFHGQKLTWRDWYNQIKEFFDDMFFIPLDCEEKSIKHNKGIYRDTVNSKQGFPDAQFRPNFLISMTVAPSLFNTDHAWYALGMVEKELLGHLGMRTLCPRDWAYRGYYDNNNHSTDGSIANGFNYHQGPEWVWLTGFYLRAKIIFAKRKYATADPTSKIMEKTITHVQQVLGRLYNHIIHDKWKSLPELTNKDGEFCSHSCTAQAWSISCTFEALHHLISLTDD